MQVAFGAGIFWGTPLTDATGAAIAVPTPVQLGLLQDFSIDQSFETKMLYGQNQYPQFVGRGKAKLSGKAKLAQLNGATLNSLIYGQTLAAGNVADVYDTTGIAIPATPFTVTAGATDSATTVKIPNSGTWSVDLGVRDANGAPMQRVAAGPIAGQYSVTAGAYLFAAADVAKVVYINYQYTSITPASAKTLTVTSLPMGYAPVFRADISVPFQGKNLTIILPQCIASKFTLQSKQDDFVIPDLDFEGFADAAGRAIYWDLSE